MKQTTQLVLQKHNVNLINQVLNSNQPTKIAAEEGIKIALVDAKTGQAAKNLKAKKIADDLLIADENGETLLTIEDYYLTDDIQLGTVSDTGFVEFAYVSSETGVTSQIASETSYTTLISGMLTDTSFIEGISNGVLLGSLGAAALGIAAISSGSSDNSPKVPANKLPVSKDSLIAATEDTIVSGKLEAATDVDGDTLTYTLATAATNGKVVISKDGSYTYTPNADFNGKDSFTYTINDGQGGVITQTATVNVAAVNDAPVSENTIITATEDTIVSGKLEAATDVDGDTLTYTLATATTNGKVVISKDGSYTYTPNANFHGKDSFTYTVTDGTETITKTANITVASVNDLPVSKDSLIAATEDTIVSGKLEAATDVDGDTLTYTLATAATNGKVVISKDGSYTYTPNADFNGKDSFTYTINDGQGGVITQTATVNVAAVNDAPVSEDSVIGVAENIVDTGVLAKATDVDGDTLTYTLLTEAVNGTVIVNKDGSYSYTPNTDFKGEDSFTYTVSDGNGAIITKTANVNVAPFDQKYNFELQEVFETNVVSEQQTVVEKQTASYINEVIEFGITGQNGMPQLELTNGSNVIRGNYSYTLQGSGISSSSNGSISSVGSNNYLIDFSTGTLPPGKYILDLYVYSPGSSIDFNVTEFKDVEYTNFTGYQDVTGNIFASDSGAISTPKNYEIQIEGQSLVFQTGNPAASPITVNTDNGKLTLAADGSYSYRSNRTDLGLEAQKLAEDFYVKVIDLDTKQVGHYGIDISSDITPPEPGELVFNNFEDTGLSKDDGITSDRSFDLTVKNNEAGSQVEYQYTTNKGVTWEVLANGIVSDLPEGNYNFRAKVTDQALNESFTAVKDITIDTTAPILGDILNFNTATNQLEVNADIDQDTLQAFKLENGTLVPIANATNIPFAEGGYQIQASDIAGNRATLDFVMATASGTYKPLIDGVDVVRGSVGNDTIYGGDGDDILISNGGSDTLYGEAGNDTLIIGENSTGLNVLYGGAGDDTYIVEAKDFTNGATVLILDSQGSNRLELKGFAPSDITLTRSDSSIELSTAGGKISLGNQLSGGAIDNIYFDDGTVWDKTTIEEMGAPKLVGTDQDDILTLTSEYSTLYGLDGNDTLKGGINNDYIYGGNGDDILISNGGSDKLYGEAGNDTLIIGENSTGLNVLYGGAGDDTYIVDVKDFLSGTIVHILDTQGSNRLDLKGVDPSDIVFTRNPLTDSIVNLSTGGGTITLSFQLGDKGGVDNIYFDDGTVWDRSAIEAMAAPKWVGTDGDDTFTATPGYSVLYGGDGNDTLKGGPNDDYIYGGNGDDILISNGGTDHLYGEAGNDTLIFGGNSAGRNTFYGGAGDDTYIVDVKDFLSGTIVHILDTQGSNRLDLKGVDPSDIVFTRNPLTDSIVNLSTGGGTITLSFQLGDKGGVDNIYFDDGTVWDRFAIEAMVNSDGSSARSVMSFDEAEDSSDNDSENDYFSESIDLGNDTETYYDSSASLPLSFDSSVGQTDTLINSPQIEMPSINNLLDLNNNELMFEQADVNNAIPLSDNNVISVSKGAIDNTAMATDFIMMHVQYINDMQKEAILHIM